MAHGNAFHGAAIPDGGIEVAQRIAVGVKLQFPNVTQVRVDAEKNQVTRWATARNHRSKRSVGHQERASGRIAVGVELLREHLIVRMDYEVFLLRSDRLNANRKRSPSISSCD